MWQLAVHKMFHDVLNQVKVASARDDMPVFKNFTKYDGHCVQRRSDRNS
jgi:hypothetical protein